MTFLRHSARHVHRTVVNYLTEQLDALGWLDDTTTPFGAPPLTIRDVSVLPSDGSMPAAIQPGMVTITLGDEDDSIDQELGGPLAASEHPIFVDIFMDSDAAALAVALDVRDICKGRLPNTTRFLPVIDQVTSTPVDGWKIELTDIVRAKPDSPLKVHWQVVKVTAYVEFPEETY